MIDVHLSVELLEAVADGSLSRETFLRLALEHALTSSPRVAAVAKQLAAEVTAPSAAPTPADYDDVFERVQASTGAWLAAKSADERAGQLDFVELMRLPSAQWSRRVQGSRHRFRTPSVAERLLSIAKSALIEGLPEEAMNAARAAFWVAKRLSAGNVAYEALQREMVLRASAYEAMASRARGDLPAARRLMATVRAARALGDLGSDPLAETEVAYFEGLMDRDDERFSDAEAVLLVTITTANALGAATEEAVARLAFARSLARSDELEEAAETLRAVGTEELLDTAPATLFAVYLESAEILARLDRPREASSALATARPLAAELGGTAPGRLALTRGLLSARRGWRPEGLQELERAHALLISTAPLVAARAVAVIAESALVAGRPREFQAACARLQEVAGLPEQAIIARTTVFAARPEGEDARDGLADLCAYFAAADESPGLVFHRAYPGAQRLAR